VTFHSFEVDIQLGGHSLDKYKSITVTELTAAYAAFATASDASDSGIIQPQRIR
jgi:hypothetical protein